MKSSHVKVKVSVVLGKAEAPSNLWWKYAELQEEDLLNHVKNGQVQRCFDSRQHAPLKPALSNSDVRVSQKLRSVPTSIPAGFSSHLAKVF